MQLLSLAVALFAVLSLWVSFSSGDQTVLLVTLASVILAVTTYRSRGMSKYLRIFATIFAIETIVFGLLYLISAQGLWPESLADYELPESLPLTVAIFGILIYAISHIPVIRQMMAVADPYFETNEPGLGRIWPFRPINSTESRVAIAMIVFLVLINQAQVAMSIRLSFFNRDWFNAIQNKDQAEFWRQLLTVWVPWVVILLLSAIIEYVVQSTLIIRWRRWLTNRYVGRWLNGNTHYRMALAGSQTDNPDQRIAEDVNRFIDPDSGLYGYSITLISNLSSLVSFSIILWSLSANFTLPWTDIKVPGFLFWVALIYATVGTLVTHMIGHPLSKLLFTQQKYEADMRFSIARLREYGEQVALLDGEPVERTSVMGRFAEVFSNYMRIVGLRKWLLAFTYFYGQISPLIPYIFAAPFYFAGKIQLGVMTQTASAFSRVEGALNFFVTYYVSLAAYKAVLDRLSTFDDAMDRAEQLNSKPPRIDQKRTLDPALHLVDLDLALPDGRQIVGVPDLTLNKGQSVLLTGPSGSGKSTLFRAISGIWPYGEGQIDVPQDARVMLLPQRPYIPMGSLRDAVTYPAASNAYDDEAIEAALAAVQMQSFANRLDEDGGWAQRLSGGEQQRIAVARALLAKPDWLFLDEATSALDEPSEQRVYETLAERLPDTTIVSIGHRSSLLPLHQRHLDMQAGQAGRFSPNDVAPAHKA
jgi:putative ATP-binding cassette transporter